MVFEPLLSNQQKDALIYKIVWNFEGGSPDFVSPRSLMSWVTREWGIRISLTSARRYISEARKRDPLEVIGPEWLKYLHEVRERIRQTNDRLEWNREHPDQQRDIFAD